ncbi:hypothetical protein AQUCO_01300488v1 [Aquilegia coerulea]|uniref:D-isomer specific 2-hydroxyacid dehydrogenase NAD-binding domain-containing protein n=1 Tax=Aquilegia coerulea TaxID=218851 RepID=A0A2G5E225_AQUCA|nr:hypothetical protein AQUCO_01300488v1 [Aquilegia coerulea]
MGELVVDELEVQQYQEEVEEINGLSPLVLLYGPTSLLSVFGSEALENKFRFLKPWENPQVPIHEFLLTHAMNVKACLCLGKTELDAKAIQCLPSLEIVVTCAAGLNHIDLVECRRRGILVTNAGNVYAIDGADYCVGLLLDVLRRVSAGDRYVRSGMWPLKGEYRLGSKLNGKRVGIIGLGSIGTEVMKRLLGFNCKISYNSRSKKPWIPYPYYSSVYDLAVNNDVLILLCSLTDETFHVINKEVLAALGKDGVVINIGRGPLIDEKELVRCLVNDEIAGAGLDVFENEPEVPKELLTLDNVVLSPHKAVFTPESFIELQELIVGNLEAYFMKKPLLSLYKNE